MNSWRKTGLAALLLGLITSGLIASGLITSGPAGAADNIWYTCQTDGECILVPRSSCHSAISINRLYLSDYKKFMDDYETRGECAEPPLDEPNIMAKCVDKLCVVATMDQRK